MWYQFCGQSNVYMLENGWREIIKQCDRDTTIVVTNKSIWWPSTEDCYGFEYK